MGGYTTGGGNLLGTSSGADVAGQRWPFAAGQQRRPYANLLPGFGFGGHLRGLSQRGGQRGHQHRSAPVHLNLSTANANTYTGAGGYCPAGSVDVGSVQTDYVLQFTTNPAVTESTGVAFPVAVTLSENGLGVSGVSIPVTASAGTLERLAGFLRHQRERRGELLADADQRDNPERCATDGSAIWNAGADGSQLGIQPGPGCDELAFNTAPASTVTAGGNGGSTIVVDEEDLNGVLVPTSSDTITLTVTGPNTYSRTNMATASGGAASFNLSTVQLTASGAYSYTASIAASPSVTNATASETVGAATAASVSVISGSGQSAIIGAASRRRLRSWWRISTATPSPARRLFSPARPAGQAPPSQRPRPRPRTAPPA